MKKARIKVRAPPRSKWCAPPPFCIVPAGTFRVPSPEGGAPPIPRSPDLPDGVTSNDTSGGRAVHQEGREVLQHRRVADQGVAADPVPTGDPPMMFALVNEAHRAANTAWREVDAAGRARSYNAEIASAAQRTPRTWPNSYFRPRFAWTAARSSTASRPPHKGISRRREHRQWLSPPCRTPCAMAEQPRPLHQPDGPEFDDMAWLRWSTRDPATRPAVTYWCGTSRVQRLITESPKSSRPSPTLQRFPTIGSRYWMPGVRHVVDRAPCSSPRCPGPTCG